MGRVTAALFGVELMFTSIKSLFQNLPAGTPRRRPVVAISFVIESLVGVALVAVLAYSAVKSANMLTYRAALLTGVALVSVAEFMSIFTEFRHLLAVMETYPAKDMEHGRKRRKAMKFFSFIVGSIAPVSAIIILELSKTSVRFAEPLMGGCVVANIFMMVHGYSAPTQGHMRMVVSLAYFFTGTGISLVLHFGAWVSDQGKEFSFDPWVVPALFCSPIASACTAVAAWSLRNIREEGALRKAHAEVFEMAAVGLTGPAVVMAFAVKNGLSVRNIYLTVFPQVGAILLPFLVSYFASCLLSLYEQNEGSNVQEVGANA